MRLPAHRYLDRVEERKKDKGARTWTFDYDSTITAAPERMSRIAKGLKAQGDRIVIITGNTSPRKDLVKAIDDYGFPFDELIQYHDEDSNGLIRAKYLEELDAWGAFDNRIDRAYIFAKVCPHLYVIAKPTDDQQDDAKGTKKQAKKAVKALESQDG